MTAPLDSACESVARYQHRKRATMELMLQAIANVCADAGSMMERRAAYWTAGIPCNAETMAWDAQIARQMNGTDIEL